MNEQINFKLDSDPENIFFRCVRDCADTVMITDAKGKIIFTNTAWQSLYGFGAEEVVGCNAKILHSGRHDKSFYQKMWAAIGNPKIGYWRGEIINRSKSGNLISLLLTISSFKNSEGDIQGYMGVAVDLTKQKELERKLRSKEDLGLIRHFSERLAHEMGTTLGVIRGRSEFLLKKVNEPASVEKELRTIISQSDRISKLVGYLLKFSRNTESKSTENIALLQKVENVLQPLEKKIKGSLIKLELNISPELAVQGDRKRLFHVITSLLENAVDAIEESIRDGNVNEHKILLNAYRSSVGVVLEVRDTGGGIPTEHIEKVFQPFFTTKDIGKGAGMGLTMASRFVEDMGGEISVENDASGAVFKVVLPPAA